MKFYCVERYVQVPLSLVQAHLDPESLALAVHLLAETVARRRTQVDVSKEAIGARAHMSWRPTQRAFADLQERGLLELSLGARSAGGFCTRVKLAGALAAAYVWSEAPPAQRQPAVTSVAAVEVEAPPRNAEARPRESRECTPAIPRASIKQMKNIQETSSSKSDARTEDVVVSPEHQGPFSVLRAWGVPVKRALNDLLSYPLEAVQKAIRIAQNTADAQNPPALYTAALRENWELPAALMKAQDKQRKMVDFQSRLVVSTVPNDVQTLGEQPAPKPINSPLEGLSEAERETLRDEAKRRLGRLLGRPVERIRLDNPLMEGTMMEIAQERNLLVSAPER